MWKDYPLATFILAFILIIAFTGLLKDKQPDEAELTRIAIAHDNPEVRREATMNLTDQSELAKIAITDRDPDVRRAAVDKLTDQAELARVGMWVKPEVTREVEDQDLLARVALEAMDANVRHAAVEKLTDQSLLAKIAVEDMNENVRDTARDKVIDEGALSVIAMDAKDPNVRRAAVQKLTDQTVLAKIAMETRDASLRNVAVAKLTDHDLIEHVRRGTAKTHTDQIVLAKNEAEPDLSNESVQKYKNFDCLKGQFPRLRLLSCSGGTLVVDAANFSPLRRNVGPVALESSESKSYNKIVQEIPTKTQGKEYLDAGYWFNNVFASIYQIVPPMKIFQIPLRMVEGLLEVIMSIFSSENEDVHTVTVDNAMDYAVDVYIDDLDAVHLPARSHKTLLFRSGVRSVAVKRSSDGKAVERFRASFPSEHVAHIYNVNSKNRYKII